MYQAVVGCLLHTTWAVFLDLLIGVVVYLRVIFNSPPQRSPKTQGTHPASCPQLIYTLITQTSSDYKDCF